MYTKAALEVVEQLEAEAIDDGVVDEAKGKVFNDELAFVHSFYKTGQSRGSQNYSIDHSYVLLAHFPFC